MSSVVISGDTSGSVSVTVPAVAGSNTITLPAVTGTAVVGSSAVSAVGQIPFSTDGSTYTPTAKIVSGTSVASTSGTSIDFTSIPSWVKRVTIMFTGFSTNGTSNPLVQLGTGAGPTFTTSGYTGTGSIITTGVGSTNFTTGIGIRTDIAASVFQGTVTLTNLTGNTWVGTVNGGCSDAVRSVVGGGSVALGAVLTAVRITTVNGTDTFDAGSINILYE